MKTLEKLLEGQISQDRKFCEEWCLYIEILEIYGNAINIEVSTRYDGPDRWVHDHNVVIMHSIIPHYTKLIGMPQPFVIIKFDYIG